MADGTWAPVATGELFLGFKDEDGLMGVEPANAKLRNGGTYLVWRKLEQDVAGFHAFLEERRRDPDERARLAAQMMGRWPNGTPVVRHPDAQAATTANDANTINDFRFEAEDTHGQKCPVGAHVRRTNPRDHLNGEAARRHRVLRRGISYGGSLMPPGSNGDGEPRGLFFVALNARIDLQFEFIQRDWINSGEVFGRAGAGLCPLTGASEERHTDAFQESGRTAPETHLPRFVTTRGGDYFFVPSLDALGALKELGGIADEKDRLPPDATTAAYRPGEGSIRPGFELISKEQASGIREDHYRQAGSHAAVDAALDAFAVEHGARAGRRVLRAACGRRACADEQHCVHGEALSRHRQAADRRYGDHRPARRRCRPEDSHGDAVAGLQRDFAERRQRSA